MIVAVTIAIGFLLWWFDGRKHKAEPYTEQESPENEQKPTSADPAQPNVKSGASQSGQSGEGSGQSGEGEGECCGMHIVCEKNLLTPLDDEIEYFDDEEIDRFRGRGADDYSDEEIEEFRDILLTLRPTEIAAWARSLQLRGIVMPQTIRDELLLIVAEERAKAAATASETK